MKNRILKILKGNDNYISGQSIAKELNISRNAIHKHIQSLKELGYSIESKRSSGYRLINSINFIDSLEVENKFKNSLFAKKIIHLKSIPSTNDEAYKLAEEGCDEGTIILSEKQTKGKGRLGRAFESSMKNNLYFSILLRPKLSPAAAPKITLLSALSVVAAIEETSNLKPKVKWPNDIFINDKKVCGILTEMKSETDRIDFMILGIGVNVNSSVNDYPNKFKPILTTLSDEERRLLPRQQIFEKIITNFERIYATMKNDEFSEKILKKWADSSYLMGKKVTVNNADNKITGTVIGIDESGFLNLKVDGKIKRVFSGTIEVVG
ncbi:biotin--[acetyl-CoA-carboxylase] ligase [Thermodesulfobacteriota bacterium]